MKSYKYNIRLNEFEQRLLKDLTKLGWNYATIISLAIRAYHAQEFGDLKRKRVKKLGADPIDEHKRIPNPELRADDDIPPEEYCTDVLGGRITELEGVRCCEFDDNGVQRIKRLDKIKKVNI